MPLVGAMLASNSEMASSPPADAPIPTTVNDAGGSSLFVPIVVTDTPVTMCGLLHSPARVTRRRAKNEVGFQIVSIESKEFHQALVRAY
jgi:hypothetical protein